VLYGVLGIKIIRNRKFTQFLFTRAKDFCCVVLFDVHVEVIWITISYLSLFCLSYLSILCTAENIFFWQYNIYFNVLDS